MASIYHGRGAALGFGQEGVGAWGTPVARANWRPLISAGLARTEEKVPRPHLLSSAGSAMRRNHFTQASQAGGAFSIEATYDNIGMLIKNLMGGDATTGAGPYVHTYTLAQTLPDGLTMEFNRGTGTSEVLSGCKLNTGTLAVSSGGVMTFDADIIAKTSTARGVAGTPLYGPNQRPILHSHATQFTFNSVSYDLVDFSLTVNNSLARRQLLGSALTAEPKRSDFQSVEMSCTVEVEDALYAALLADTQGDATISFTNGSQIFAFTCQNAYLSAVTDPVSDANIVSQSLTFVCESDGTDEGLSIAVTNDNSDSFGN
jgi:hypothetical protein